VKIHAIQTGTVAIKTHQVEGAGNGTRRQLNMFLDREWTEPLPGCARPRDGDSSRPAPGHRASAVEGGGMIKLRLRGPGP
jgi:hypothetical protein